MKLSKKDKEAIIAHADEYLNGDTGRVKLWTVEISDDPVLEHDQATCSVVANADLENKKIELRFTNPLHDTLEDILFLMIGEINSAVGSMYLTQLLTEAENKLETGKYVLVS